MFGLVSFTLTTKCIHRTVSRVRLTGRKMATFIQPEPVQQKFDFFLVLDFEATCDDKRQLIHRKKEDDRQEVIEFPCLKVNAKTGNIESTFHEYVQPKVHKELSPFCIELTGIIQDMVDGKPHLEEVLKSFDTWMKHEGLVGGDKASAFVTCGDWDLRNLLPIQCKHFDIKPAAYFNQWINIKKSFVEVTGVFPKGMMPMLSMMKLKHVGRHHSGIDDCKNIAAILKALLKRDHIFKINGGLGQHHTRR